ncbi:helix-turn-helix transcriptional regulator [Streptomyces sp. NPDC002790]|uniref:helix-turn-helix domain-containing protein n=1 Tax=Streptomyces sp. NPDC002790 TaxID=3154431 RepID=UPI00331D3132
MGRRLGGELLRLRDASGKTQQQAAVTINATQSKIVKMERGWVPMRDPDIHMLCEFYGAADRKTVAKLSELAGLDRERRKAQGWWRHVAAGEFAEYIAMEDAATRVRNWQLSLVPGLLQIPAYTRSLAVNTGPWETPDFVEHAVDVKRQRQKRLYGERPLTWFGVVWEAALRQQVGGPSTMRAQLDHLLDVGELPNVTIQVLPFRAGAHPCVTGAFSVLSFAEAGSLDVVQSDTVTGMGWVEDIETGARYGDHFDRTARMSLSARESLELINSLRKEA